MTKQETYPDGTPLFEGDSLEDNPQGGWVIEDDICSDPALNRIAEELQCWSTDLLITMAPFTHGDGNRLIRLTLAGRGVGKLGYWVGFDRAAAEWGV